MNESSGAGPAAQGPGSRRACPWRTAWEEYKASELAAHVRVMKREGLLAARCVLDWCLEQAEDLQRGKTG